MISELLLLQNNVDYLAYLKDSIFYLFFVEGISEIILHQNIPCRSRNRRYRFLSLSVDINIVLLDTMLSTTEKTPKKNQIWRLSVTVSPIVRLPWPCPEQQLPGAHAHLQPHEHLHAPDGNVGLLPHVRTTRERLQLHQAPQGAQRLPRLIKPNGPASEPEVLSKQAGAGHIHQEQNNMLALRTRWPRK
jgi:hypothetical protein